MSAQELITQHLDLWTGAVTTRSTAGRGRHGKIELTGIKKLRELILELAVRGKLVNQDPDDEPASVLLERIAEEKARLVKEGKIKKPKGLLPVEKGSMPFALPEGWSWIRLGETMEMYNGKAFKSSEWSSTGLPIVRIQNLNDPYAPTNHFSGKLDERNKINSGTFLISWSGTPGTSFGAFIWERGPAALNQHINKCVFFGDHLNPRFMKLAVNGQMSHFIQSAQGGVGLKHVTKGVLNNALIALPPFSEQCKIVEKFDELMALCDRLEQQVGDQLEAHEVLVDTLLDALTRSTDAAEVADNWARISEHFDTLFTTEASIDKLKQAILQLAVMGRLVEQVPNDEPASVLLERIAEEKARLVKEGRIKKPKKYSNVSLTEKAFSLHSSWKWIRLGELLEAYRDISYGIIKLEKEPSTGGIPTLRCSDVKPGHIDVSSVRKVSEEIEMPYSRTRIKGGEVLLNIRGTLGGVGLATSKLEGFNIAREVAMIPFHGSISGRYMVILILSTYFWSMIEENLKGIAYKGLNLKTLREMPIPLPPVTEQHRIVEKVDELMALCDKLKIRLGEAGESRSHLAEAVVEKAVS